MGRAILDFCEQSGTPRSDIFFTTKLKLNNGLAKARKSIQASLKACGLGYIDLYLLHGPIGGPKARSESWQAVVEAKEAGILRSIGISTFGVRHMEEMVHAGVELPVVHQVAFTLFIVISKLNGRVYLD